MKVRTSCPHCGRPACTRQERIGMAGPSRRQKELRFPGVPRHPCRDCGGRYTTAQQEGLLWGILQSGIVAVAIFLAVREWYLLLIPTLACAYLDSLLCACLFDLEKQPDSDAWYDQP